MSDAGMSDAALVGTDRGLVRLGAASASTLEEPIVHLASRSGVLPWALTGKGTLWRARNDEWERMAQVDGLRANCVLPLHGGTVLLGTSEARLLRLGEGGLERVASFDAAEGRDRWFTPWGGPPDVRSLAADPAGSLYANVHVGGVLRSQDGGRTWELTALDIETDVHQVLADPRQPGTVVAATAFGLAVSGDAGRTWEVHDGGLHATYCRAVAVTDDGPLVSASRGHHGREAAVYRFLGDRFERCREGLPERFEDNVDTYCLDARGRVAALGTSAGEVFLSRDAGGTWERIADGLPPVRSVLLGEQPGE
jgi:photosystem II stability/assembly factor-like uncharacterized protein